MSDVHYKNQVIVDLDTERENPILIGKSENYEMPYEIEDYKTAILLDISTLCEGICTLMHLAESLGIQKSPVTLRECIKHLEHGFADPDYVSAVMLAPTKLPKLSDEKEKS